MSEPREQCCGNCWWWIRCWSNEGMCFLDASNMLASDVCPQWEIGKGTDKPDEPEEVDHGP